MSAGYSKRPLSKKLGLKAGMQITFVDAPDHYAVLLGPLPHDVQLHARLEPERDFVHFFTTSAEHLREMFPQLKAAIKKDGMLWISWPKKASKVETNLDGNGVREIGLENGLVDVKVCAVDDVWSGLKFVYRVEDR